MRRVGWRRRTSRRSGGWTTNCGRRGRTAPSRGATISQGRPQCNPGELILTPIWDTGICRVTCLVPWSQGAAIHCRIRPQHTPNIPEKRCSMQNASLICPCSESLPSETLWMRGYSRILNVGTLACTCLPTSDLDERSARPRFHRGELNFV
jgi:hypothetical protein